VIVIACVQGAPHLEQSLLWQTGMLTYVLPLVLLTLYGGWLARRLLAAQTPRWRDALAGGALLFVTAGLAETSMAVQLTLLVLGTVGYGLIGSNWATARHRLLASGLAATLVAATVVVVAPGNYLHEIQVTGSVHGLSQMPEALRAGVDFVGLFARAVEFRARGAVVVVFSLSLWLGLHSARAHDLVGATRGWLVRVGLVLGAVGCGWLLLLAAIVPGYFAQQWDVPERAQIVGVWVVVLTLGVVGYVIGEATGQLLRRSGVRLDRLLMAPGWGLALLTLTGAPLLTLPGVLAPVATDAAYAADWDALDTTIREQAARRGPVLVDHTLPTHFGFDFLTTDPNLYPNPCVARFYGVPTITVVP
jgi:uncharacterized protein YejL (UPF0352 family)